MSLVYVDVMKAMLVKEILDSVTPGCSNQEMEDLLYDICRKHIN